MNTPKKTITVLDCNEVLDMPVPPMKERPVCPGCEEPRVVKISEDKTQYQYIGYGFFCSLKCATNWANNKIKAKVS